MSRLWLAPRFPRGLVRLWGRETGDFFQNLAPLSLSVLLFPTDPHSFRTPEFLIPDGRGTSRSYEKCLTSNLRLSLSFPRPSLNRGQRQLPEESDLCLEGSALPVLPDVEGNDQERKRRESARDFLGR